MPKFLFSWIKIIGIILIFINVCSVNSKQVINKNKDNKMLMFNSKNNVRLLREINSKPLMSDIKSLFGEIKSKNKRNMNKRNKLLESKHKIQQLLKARRFLESLSRHVRSARLKHYARYLRLNNGSIKNSRRRKKHIIKRTCSNLCLNNTTQAKIDKKDLNNKSNFIIFNIVSNDTALVKKSLSTEQQQTNPEQPQTNPPQITVNTPEFIHQVIASSIPQIRDNSQQNPSPFPMYEVLSVQNTSNVQVSPPKRLLQDLPKLFFNTPELLPQANDLSATAIRDNSEQIPSSFPMYEVLTVKNASNIQTVSPTRLLQPNPLLYSPYELKAKYVAPPTINSLPNDIKANIRQISSPAIAESQPSDCTCEEITPAGITHSDTNGNISKPNIAASEEITPAGLPPDSINGAASLSNIAASEEITPAGIRPSGINGAAGLSNIAASEENSLGGIPPSGINGEATQFNIAASENITPAGISPIGTDCDSTTEITTENNLINKIFEDVEELKTGKVGTMKEDLPCEISGRWISSSGGLILELCTDNQTNVQVTTASDTPSKNKGFMLEDKYKFDGNIPFPKSGMVVINGIGEESKHVATFIGQCLVCNGAESISGQWLIARKSRNCIDAKATQQIIGDVWTKEKLTEFRRKRIDFNKPKK